MPDKIFQFKRKLQQQFPPGTIYNYQFVNFDTFDVWPQILSYLGPSILYSGELWEILCQGLRRGKLSNGKQQEYSALSKVSKHKFLQWSEYLSKDVVTKEVIDIAQFKGIGMQNIRLLSTAEVKNLHSCYSI